MRRETAKPQNKPQQQPPQQQGTRPLRPLPTAPQLSSLLTLSSPTNAVGGNAKKVRKRVEELSRELELLRHGSVDSGDDEDDNSMLFDGSDNEEEETLANASWQQSNSNKAGARCTSPAPPLPQHLSPVSSPRGSPPASPLHRSIEIIRSRSFSDDDDGNDKNDSDSASSSSSLEIFLSLSTSSSSLGRKHDRNPGVACTPKTSNWRTPPSVTTLHPPSTRSSSEETRTNKSKESNGSPLLADLPSADEGDYQAVLRKLLAQTGDDREAGSPQQPDPRRQVFVERTAPSTVTQVTQEEVGCPVRSRSRVRLGPQAR